MKNFAVSADSTCDLTTAEIAAWDVYVAPLAYTMSQGEQVQVGTDNFTNLQQYRDFYQQLRDGVIARTSILSVQAHVDLFTRMAQAGIKNTIHIAQGYGLSPTVDNANAAIKQVKAQFPDLNYVAIESNTTTRVEGLLVQAAVKLRDEGKTLPEAVAQLTALRPLSQHFVLVNDLKFLARGGRISNLAAGFGSMLQVKPIIEFGRDGKLKVCRKEIGLKRAMRSIVNDFGKFTLNRDFPYIVIIHTDNEPLARELQAMFKATYGLEPPIAMMGPIIGAHIGPGAVAYGFLSNEERPYA